MSDTNKENHPAQFIAKLEDHAVYNLKYTPSAYTRKFQKYYEEILACGRSVDWEDMSAREFCLRVMPTLRKICAIWTDLVDKELGDEHPSVAEKINEYKDAAYFVLYLAKSAGVLTGFDSYHGITHAYMADEMSISKHTHPSQSAAKEAASEPEAEPEAAAHCAHIIRSFTEPMRTKYMNGQREHGGSLAKKPVFPMMKEEILDMWCYYKVAEDQQNEVKRLLAPVLRWLDDPTFKGAITNGDFPATVEVMHRKIKQAYNILEHGNADGIPLSD